MSNQTKEVEAASSATVPMWLLMLLLMLLFLGGWLFDLRGGWFDSKVYGPYTSLANVENFQPMNDPKAALFAKGKLAFSTYCAVCHMETGAGNPANGCPPLVGSEWVTAPSPGRMIRIMSKGATGPITVGGKVWSTGTMLPVGDQLPGDEDAKAETIAAIATYVKKAFGNVPEIVTPEQVKAIRAEIKDRTQPYNPDELIKTVPEK